MQLTTEKLKKILREEVVAALRELNKDITKYKAAMVAFVDEKGPFPDLRTLKQAINRDRRRGLPVGVDLDHAIRKYGQELVAGAMLDEEAKNPWAICTDSIAKTAGTTERSEWSEAEMERYERCVKDVKKEK